MALTVVVALDLYTIYSLEYPFVRGIRVEPDAFELVLRTIGGNGQA